MFRLTVDSGDALARLFGPVASAGVRLNGRGASSGRRENVRPNPTPARLRRRRKIAYSDGLIPSRRRHCESGFVRRSKQMVDDKSRLQCAGLNRHEVEDERALRERSSDPLGLESCAATARDTAKRRQRIGGVGIQLRKDATRTPTSL